MPEDIFDEYTKPPQHPGPFWKFLWRKGGWSAYYNPTVPLALLVLSVSWGEPWYLITLWAVLWLVGLGFTIGWYRSYRFWVRMWVEDCAWVDSLVSVGYPREIVQVCHNLIDRGQTPAAARLLLTYVKNMEEMGQWPPKRP